MSENCMNNICTDRYLHMYTGSQADQTEAGARVATKMVALMLGLAHSTTSSSPFFPS